ncbi:HdeA/HdeB family chaperone [Methylocella sp.]|uniref:HdeA/HdeB family chaperone n=1 Tax=Methylocella sp. TaxID=1978226 RepID=UPI0035AE8016
MKKTIAAALFIFTAAQSAQAQVMIDMSVITCAQLLEQPEAKAPFVTAWMAGYFAATQDRSTIDLRYLERNINVATDYCREHKSDTLMSVVQKTAK